MQKTDTFQPPEEGFRKLLIFGASAFGIVIAVIMYLIGLVLLILLLMKLYAMFTDVSAITVDKTPPTAIDMLEPPPPPPPPPPEPKPEEKPPEPTEKPTPIPEPAPAPTPDQPAPMKIDGPAQAGSDSFGMSAGSGGGGGAPGSSGSCTTPPCGVAAAPSAPRAPSALDRFWGPSIARALEDRLEASKKVNPNAYLAEFRIWVDASGSVTRAELVRGSNDRKLDQIVLTQLEQARGLKPPPPSIQMPQRIKVGRKRLTS